MNINLLKNKNLIENKKKYLAWLNNRKNELKSYKQKSETNVAIVVHLFHVNLFTEFLKYIQNVKTIFKNVTVIFTINDANFEKIIKQKDPTFIVLKVENKGVDVHAFLESIKFIRNQNIQVEFILKIHTKVSTTPIWRNWRKELIEPITDLNNLIAIQNYFKKVKNIGYIGAEKCILPKKFDLRFPQNIYGLNNLIEKFPHLQKNWNSFNAGNMFWINNEVLTKYLTDDLMSYFDDKFCRKKPPSNNVKNKGIFVEYLCERLFSGVFCYDSTNILIGNTFSFYKRK
uniref:Rhamnan synthesis protein F n=1 Tax=viral metagenome TaxID=1070528 RepID=A0A6C0HSN1_9ZZZZ